MTPTDEAIYGLGASGEHVLRFASGRLLSRCPVCDGSLVILPERQIVRCLMGCPEEAVLLTLSDHTGERWAA